MILNENGKHIKEYFDEQNGKQVLFDLHYRDYYEFPVGLLLRYGLTQGDGRRLLNDIRDYHCAAVMVNYPDLSSRGVCECVRINERVVDFGNGQYLLEGLRGQDKVKLSVSQQMYIKRLTGTQSAWDWFKWRCYLSLKSISGRCNFKKSTNEIMLSRVAGYGKSKGADLSMLVNENGKPFCTDYYCNKVRNELQEEYKRFYWYSHYTRGFYFTFRKSKADLIAYAESRRPSNIAERRKAEERQLREQAIQAIKKPLY